MVDIPSDGYSSPPSSFGDDPHDILLKMNLLRMEMGPYEIVCKCEEGKMIRKCSKSEKNRNRMYYCCPKSKKTETRGWDWGCKYFLWENELKPCPCGEGKCAENECREKGRKVLWCSRQTQSSGGIASEEGQSSGGFASQEGCCSLLSVKNKILEAKLEVAQSPEKHANTSADLYEALETVGRMVDGLLLDH